MKGSSQSDRKDMPAEYEGMFKTNQWNALKIYKFYTGPNGYHFKKTPQNECKALFFPMRPQ